MKFLFSLLAVLLLPAFSTSQVFEEYQINEDVSFIILGPSYHAQNEDANWFFNGGQDKQVSMFVICYDTLERYDYYTDTYVIRNREELKNFYNTVFREVVLTRFSTHRKYNWSTPYIRNLLAFRNEGEFKDDRLEFVEYHDDYRFILNGKVYLFSFNCALKDLEIYNEMRNTFFNSIKFREGLTIENQFNY